MLADPRTLLAALAGLTAGLLGLGAVWRWWQGRGTAARRPWLPALYALLFAAAALLLFIRRHADLEPRPVTVSPPDTPPVAAAPAPEFGPGSLSAMEHAELLAQLQPVRAKRSSRPRGPAPPVVDTPAVQDDLPTEEEMYEAALRAFDAIERFFDRYGQPAP